MSRWYRAYEGTVTDPKLGEVAMVAGCSRSVAIAVWHCILESCALSNDGGNFDATLRRVAVILSEPLQIIKSVFSELENLKMIEGQRVIAWQKRQFESDSSTERSRKHRENNRAKADKPAATLQKRDATPPDTDTDTDTDTDKKESLASLGQQRGRELFAEFKSAYPRRKGSQPWEPAEKKFRTAVGSGHGAEAIARTIINGARAYALCVRDDDPQFTAQAVTWLNQRRWLDEHPPPTSASRHRNGKPMSNKMLALEISMKKALDRERQTTDSENIIDGTYTVEPSGGFDDCFDGERRGAGG